MEQAVNQFNKGLQSDTHPMVQGNDTLSDALNATFVTMNGNEVVLQNDMGNRRVDNAFLPSGYEPVGIKEYGGIIYVAAYNPITNRSQIGSFPSPERKIDSLDDKNLQCSFNFFEHFPADKVDENGMKFISTDSVLLPLSDEISLHAGDKFSIYCDDINEENWQKYITNYYNTENRKIKSRKNKELTLFIGILNSQNQFVDVTHTLKRWKDNVPQKYDDSYFKDYIFNDGYFISSNKIEDPSNYTLSDAQLIKNRQVIEANTYAYKLVGPLYLKIQLNHIEQFNFNIVGDKTNLSNGCQCFLQINATITYNCNDYSGNGSSDEYYKDLGDGIIDFKKWAPFDFYVKKHEEGYSKIIPYDWKGTKPIYNNGLYQTTVTAFLPTIYSENLERPKHIDYFIGVNSGVPISNPPYIQSLSTYGTIDISKLNSGEINLKNFRFFNSNESSTITYAIEAYPKIGQVYEGLSLIFCNNNEEIEVPENGKLFPLSNGRNTIQINWKETGLEPRTLYKVKFKYHIEGETTPMIDSNTRWLLTTKLFNDCYSKVLDFGEKVNREDSKEELREKLKIKLEFKSLTNPTITKLESESEGKLIDSEDKSILKYIVSDKYKIEDSPYCSVNIKDIELYPSDLNLDIYELNDNDEKIQINRLKVNSTSYLDFSGLDFSYAYDSENNNRIVSVNLQNMKDNFKSDDVIAFDYNGCPKLKYKFDNEEQIIEYKNNILTCSNVVLSEGTTKNKYIQNAFSKIHSEHFRKVLDNSTSHSGFFVSNWDTRSQDGHYIGVIINHDKLSIALKDENAFIHYKELGNAYFESHNEDAEMHYSFSDESISEFYDTMSTIDSKYTFAYIFSAISTVGATNDTYPGEFLAYVGNLDAHGWAGSIKNDAEDRDEAISACVQGYNPITCCKVWWRDPSGNWVLLNSISGVFGGNNLPIYSLPEKVKDGNEYKFIMVGQPFEKSSYYTDTYNIDDPDDPTYYNKIYYDKGNLEIKTNDVKYQLYGVNKKVQDQIMKFLDPHNDIVYCIYKSIGLSDLGLKVMDRNNCIYTLPYSGNIIIRSEYITNRIHIDIKGGNSDLLDFYQEDGNWQSKVPFYEIVIPIQANNKFQDTVNDTLDNDIIYNFYIDGGSNIDSKGNKLITDVIYKINSEGKLTKLENPPYQFYDKVDNKFNSLVSTSYQIGSSSSSPTRYLRAHGDNHSKTSLEFSGGKLKVVDYTRFLDIS